MQIRTPKKYRGRQRRSILGCRRLAFYLVALCLIGGGLFAIANQASLGPIAQRAVYDIVSQFEARAATIAAPAPTPTADPRNSLVEANNYWGRGALDQATALYIDIAESLPNTVEVFRRIALGMINRSRPAEAVEYAERAVHADPFDAEAWAIYAWALDWADRSAEALAHALHALELDPGNARATAYLAEIYSSLDQAERARLLLDDLLAEQPDSPEALRARGLIKWNQYEYEAALADFESAFRLADNMSFIAIDIAIIEMGLKNYAAARSYLQQVIDADPYNPQALFRLGEIEYQREGNYARAMRYLQDCVDLNPSYLYCFFLLGRAQDKLGAADEAAASFERAIELGSQNPQHYFWAGAAQIELGNCARAMSFLEPGYRLAVAGGYSQYAADILAIIGNCDPAFAAQAAADA